ncbi:thioredoxin-dependent thiol peroxidase [Brevundimonas balnearis]|uniref:thioredoxin-dependent peroxiredoxin n=1 Tax=Brevundimonas balnearis TaxID=1572858 RepID=A0ABV6QZT8_9CAUL
MTAITPGVAAPDFDMPADGGGRARLADLSGKRVVLYFYPKADTPGCTNEAKDFTDQIGAFDAAGAVIIGVSKDPVKKLDKFKAKYDLKVVLASDENTDVCERYGVWVEKSMYGKTYMGIERATFLIGADGKVERVWRKVSVKGHAEEVLAAVSG